MLYRLKLFFKKIIPRGFILWTHKMRGIAAAFYFDFPARKLRVVGVAGTKGKTTTTNLITRILERAGYKVAMFSTASMRVNGEEFPNTEKLTTPSPFFLQNFLREAVKKGCNYAVIEISSHALVQSRLYGIDFSKAVITNLMPDHLDYHKTADEYRDVHLKIIGPKTEAIIINGEEDQAQKLKQEIQSLLAASVSPLASVSVSLGEESSKMRELNVISFGLKSGNDLHGYETQLNSSSVKFKVEYYQKDLSSFRKISLGGNFVFGKSVPLGEFVLNIPGKFNIYNALAAISFGVFEGIDPDKIRKALICVKGVPGRLENIKISDKQDFEVIVDYAHSPDSLKNVYEAIKPYVKNRLIAVLGGTGDRDKTYRARGGELADKFADIVIVTNEDPYSEDPEDIMEQVLSGIKGKKIGEKLFRILDRKDAIKKAVNLAAKGDVILITGKGSEQFMVWGDKKIPWDDREIAREALREKIKN